MTSDERFDRLADAIERVADASNQRLGSLERAHLGLVAQVGILADITRGVVERVDTLAQQQAAMAQRQAERQAEQDQRFDILLGEIRHLARRVNGEGS